MRIFIIATFMTISVRGSSATCIDFKGIWEGIGKGSHGPEDGQYAATATSSNTFTVYSLNTVKWKTSDAMINANGTISAHYNTGTRTLGTPTSDCATIDWSDGTKWVFIRKTPLKIHINAHTHDDVGWIETYMQYYHGTGPLVGRNVSQILRAVVGGLRDDPRRRFVYVEQAFFSLYFDALSVMEQNDVRALVASGQLSFLNGGWSMHDEACPTYTDMIDNTALGHRYIIENFGVSALPTLAWQIDPFGHSSFQGVLSSPLGGYKGVMWAREAADFKAAAANATALERVWLPSASLGGAAAGFQGIFLDKGYGSPGEVSRCTHGGNKSTNATCSYALGTEDAPGLVDDIIRNRLGSFRGQDFLINLGGDFTWENAKSFAGEDLGNGFDYADAIINFLNSVPGGAITAFYSTAADYVEAKLADVASLPLVSGDFFPYNDDVEGHNMWSGYFSSRSSFKGFVRASSSLLLAARQLQALVGGVNSTGPSNPLFALERAMGVVQHHDSVSGTAKEVVNEDYAMLLDAAREGGAASISASLAAATRAPGLWPLCSLSNVTICPALEAGSPTIVAVYNALAQESLSSPVRVPIALPNGVASWSVFNDSGAEITAQIIPLSPRDVELRTLYGGSNAVNVQWLVFMGDLPASGFSTFFLVPAATQAGAPLTVFTPPGVPLSADESITNGRVTLNISSLSGLMTSYADAQSRVEIPVAQSWRAYVGANGTMENGSKQASGAYIFRADTSAGDAAVIPGTPSVSLVRGPIVSEAWTTLGYVTQVTRLWAGAADVEFEWTVGPVDNFDAARRANVSREVITRWATPLATSGEWVTDANCHEGLLRRRNARLNWTVQITEAVSGNYFPTNCLIRMSSPDVTLAVAVDRSQGSSSLTDGSVELMVHRRMVHDDGRGVAEALNEPGLDGRGLIVRGKHWLIAAPVSDAAPAYKELSARSLTLPTSNVAFSPLVGAPSAWIVSHSPRASLLKAPLPPSLHLATVQVLNASSMLLRIAHVYDVGEHSLSADVSVDLANLFVFSITAAIEMTLPASRALADVPKRTYTTDGGAVFNTPVIPPPPVGSALTVVIGAGQVRTFICTM